jgi:hypothetical protein
MHTQSASGFSIDGTTPGSIDNGSPASRPWRLGYTMTSSREGTISFTSEVVPNSVESPVDFIVRLNQMRTLARPGDTINVNLIILHVGSNGCLIGDTLARGDVFAYENSKLNAFGNLFTHGSMTSSTGSEMVITEDLTVLGHLKVTGPKPLKLHKLLAVGRTLEVDGNCVMSAVTPVDIGAGLKISGNSKVVVSGSSKIAIRGYILLYGTSKVVMLEEGDVTLLDNITVADHSELDLSKKDLHFGERSTVTVGESSIIKVKMGTNTSQWIRVGNGKIIPV